MTKEQSNILVFLAFLIFVSVHTETSMMLFLAGAFVAFINYLFKNRESILFALTVVVVFIKDLFDNSEQKPPKKVDGFIKTGE